MGKTWPALVLRSQQIDDSEDFVSAVLTDFSPVAIHDLAERPLPPGGLWDPTYPPIPDPPPTPLHWNVCFNDAVERDRAAAAIRDALPDLTIESADLPDEDWAARSQQSLTAVHAGAFIVAPPWDIPADPGTATVIVIEPSMGFGTGHHATTRMCLRLLSDIDVADQTVLDLGTGSGVLSMAAALMGARRVTGIDVDQDAINSAESSARLNTLPDTIAFEVSDFRHSPPSPADIVLANLTGGMLTSSAGSIAALVKPKGLLILSGFDHTEVDSVVAAFPSFTEQRRLSEDNWLAVGLRAS
ncbi:MAG TPA: 50S ribosomal protein L11 methyltransferase [Vicinamibacterales bacterium]|nr:50S ribosomal protein L11 methyltransferase [Vicinamibacterales bacterium]